MLTRCEDSKLFNFCEDLCYYWHHKLLNSRKINIMKTNSKKFEFQLYLQWLRIAAIAIFVLGILDLIQIAPGLIFQIGFFFAMVGAVNSIKHLECSEKLGIYWLPISFIAWSFGELLASMYYFIAPGITQDWLSEISFRAPYWIIFGIWLFYISSKNLFGTNINSISKASNAKAIFKLTILLTFLFVIFSNPFLVEIRPSTDKVVKIGVFSGEFLTHYSNGAAGGKLGPSPMLQSLLDKELPPRFSFPLLGFWWHMGSILLLPLCWLLAHKNQYKILSTIWLAGIILHLSIPIQLKLQYNLELMGVDGCIRYPFYLLLLSFLIQGGAIFYIQKGDCVEKPFQNKEKVVGSQYPLMATALALIITIIWTFAQPSLMRTPMQNLLLAANRNEVQKFSYYFKKLKAQFPDNTTTVALCEAIDNDCINLTEWLLQKKPKLNSFPKDGNHLPLFFALRGSGNFILTEKLLASGADPNIMLSKGTFGNNGLGLVTSVHSYPLRFLAYVKLLHKHGADLNLPISAEGKYLLEIISINTLKNSYQELKRMGLKLKSAKTNLFYRAICSKNTEFIKKLINDGLNSNATDKLGNTFVHLIVRDNHQIYGQDMKEYLRPFINENINVLNKEAETPLHLAIKSNDPDLVTKLMDWGANPHKKADKSLSAYELARQLGTLRLIKIMDRKD